MQASQLAPLTPFAAMLAAGLLAGFTAGLFGIGGGFVVVPALLLVLPLLGGDPAQYAHVAIGTSAATIIFTSLRSLSAYARRGAVEFAVLRSWAPWLVLGDVAGMMLADRVDGRVLLLIFALGELLMSVHSWCRWSATGCCPTACRSAWRMSASPAASAPSRRCSASAAARSR